MKTHVGGVAAVSVFATLACSDVVAESAELIKDDAIVAIPINQTGRLQLFPRGTARAVVVRELGEPPATLGNDLWIYWDFRGGSRTGVDRAVNTLVMFFMADKVISLKLAEADVIREVLYRGKIGAKSEAIGSQFVRKP
jgi:hypothetical protein